MQVVSLILTFFFWTTLSFAQGAGDAKEVLPEDLEVEVGIDKVEKLDFDFDPRIQINDVQILKLVTIPVKREIILRGNRVGRTSVIIFDNTGERRKNWVVNVKATGPSKIVSELRELLGDIEGLEINVKADKVVAEGEVVVPTDLKKISLVLTKYPDVLSLINISPQTQRIIARKMQKEIQNAGMKDVTVRIVNGVYWLEGVVTKANDKKLAMTLAEGYVLDQATSLSQQQQSGQQARSAIMDFISLNEKKDPAPPEKQVKISAQFVELSKDYSKVFGFRWNPVIDGDGGSISIGKTSQGGVTTQSEGTLTAIIKNLFPKLLAAKNAQYARIIQSGMVVTKDKVGANITKSETFSYVVGGGSAVQPPASKDASATFSLDVTPITQDGEKVELQALNITVSIPTGKSDQGTPKIASNSIKTTVTVKSKESAVIGGIVFNQSFTVFDKDAPGALDSKNSGQLLFNFQRSKNTATSKSQFVVFVTPEIIESASTDTEDVRKKFRRRGR